MDRILSNSAIPENMEVTIKYFAGGMGGVGIWGGIVGVGADLPAIAGSWMAMTVKLADQAGHQLDSQTAKKIVLAVSAGVGMFIGGAKIATTAIGWIGALFTGGLSVLLAVGANVTLNTSLTYAYGRAVARYFIERDSIDDVEVMAAALLALMGESLGFID